MTGLLADMNFEGQAARLEQILLSDDWRDLWLSYGLSIVTFTDLGLARDTPDRVVWDRCHTDGLILLTSNRNDDGPDSLEAAIRDGPPDALPVFTVADAGRITADAGFARAVASAMVNAIDDLTSRPETVRGAGRVDLPRNPRDR